MAELTAEQFAQRTSDLNLLDERQLDSIWGEFRSRDVPVDEFRSVLLRRELLTNYQVERLMKGERSGYFYGDYKVLYRVGTGTFARVFRSVHKKTGKVVAVKVLRKRFCDDPAKTEQFLREGKMGTALRHPNIVPIYEVHQDRGSYYLVMQFVEGHNMRDFVKVRKKLDPLEGLRLITDVAAGLAYAFEKKITHRDMKMSNILISSRGRARLVDFGLAAVADQLTDEALANCPNPRSIDYAGLERVSNVRRDDPRSDTYFVGCIFYHMLTGVAPLLETKDRAQRLNMNRFKKIKPVSSLEPSLPRLIVGVVNKAMELNPSRRYQSPSVMLQDMKVVAARLAEEGNGQAGSSPPIPKTLEGASRTVMLIESNLKMQDLLRDRLKKHGYRVLVIGNPERALSRFQGGQMPADCVIFSTIELGDPNLEAFNRFSENEQTKDIPAILLTNEDQQSYQKKAKLADHRVILSMPIKLKELRATLVKLLSALEIEL